MPRTDDDHPGLAARWRAAASDVLELVQVRLELFALETREAFAHLLVLAALIVGGAVVISAGLIFLAVFVTVLLWDTHRLWALGAFAGAFLVGGLVLLRLTWLRVRGLARLFVATRGELQRDRDRLRQSRGRAAGRATGHATGKGRVS